MKATTTVTLQVKDNTISPQELSDFVAMIPDTATLKFIIDNGYDDRFSYSPTRVTGIKATWEKDL